ncbi:MAG TPA: hypothetical protein PK765_00445 [bacterium]|nr:hypothetical protein [bacterium]
MEFFLVLLALVIIGPYVLAGFSLAPWVPTPARDLDRIVRIVGARRRAGEFIEIGSGDGRVLFAVARAYPDMPCRGIEYYFPVWLYSRVRLMFADVPNARVEWGDFYRRDISEAGTLFCFGHPDTLREKFRHKLSECRPGTVLISHAFEVEGWEPIDVDCMTKSLSIRIYELPGMSDTCRDLKLEPKSV